MATVKFGAGLRSGVVYPFMENIQYDEPTLGQVLARVFEHHPQLRDKVVKDGRLTRWVNIYLDGSQIRPDSDLTEVVFEETEIELYQVIGATV